ncbi:spore cortex biosynthesis protein YabQ [Paenibacillus pasadenensis]|uniref:spore cortex biosynthesis protein YabQ n=1 Tax=Paenibacillus TaxID=44249 RepID=UPI000420C9C0|nr:spore cortex biosynthesis protein YabQ [Paenibacillus pasadenensis]
MTLETQGLTMALMLLSGVLMGTAFDGYRVVSRELRFPRWMLPPLDVAYWMIAALAVFRVLYASNDGEVRAYVYLGLGIGLCLHYLLFSGLVVGLTKWMIAAAKAVIGWLVRLTDMLVIRPLIGIYRLVRVLTGFLIAFSLFLFRIVLQLVRPAGILILWMLGPLLRPIGRQLGQLMVRWEWKEKAARVSNGFKQAWKRLFRR